MTYTLNTPVSCNAQTQQLVDALAEDLARDGLSGHEAQVVALADQACVLGVEPTLIGVLLDTSAPAVVRLRAFAAVTVSMVVLLDCERHVGSDVTAVPSRVLADLSV